MDGRTGYIEKDTRTDIDSSVDRGCDTAVCKQGGTRVGEAERRDTGVAGTTYVPAVDLIESEDTVSIIADVPGVPEGGVELTVEKNVLTLVAKPDGGAFEGMKLAYTEYGVGEYRCSFSLSDEIDKEHITASLKDGVLVVDLPKRAPVTKKITVVTV